MTREEAIKRLRELLEPGESVTVERKPKPLESLGTSELAQIYLDSPGRIREGVRAVVMADRKREVELMREQWGVKLVDWRDVAEFLGVEVEL